MIEKRLTRLAVVLTAAMLSVSMLVAEPTAAGAASIAARMDNFANPDGTNYFALSAWIISRIRTARTISR
jgi:hypothetical protein